MYATRALLLFQIRKDFVDSLNRLYHHERIAAQIYRALASNPLYGARKESLLDRADVADRKARHCAVRLSLLRPARTPGHENWPERFWRWMLLHWPGDVSIQWIEWLEHRDNAGLDSLFDARAFWQ